MNTRQIILVGIVIIALLSVTGTVVAQENSPATAVGPGGDSGTSGPDNSLIGPGSPLFGLKVAMENLDETFTFNDTRRVEKQIDHAEERINEAQQELDRNQSGYAEQALELYREKLNQTEMSLPRFSSNATGLVHAQEIIARHETLLADLLSRYPGSTGLARAYANSQELGQKFGEKTRLKFDQAIGKDNTTSLKAAKLDTGKQNDNGGNTTTSAQSNGKGKNQTQDHVKDKKGEIPVSPTVTFVQPTPGDDKGSSKDQRKKGHN
jgi:hypothetical protein